MRAPDRIGTLYRITRALADLDLDIRHAKVATLGHEVVDTFYVVDQDGAKIDRRRPRPGDRAGHRRPPDPIAPPSQSRRKTHEPFHWTLFLRHVRQRRAADIFAAPALDEGSTALRV